MFTLEHRVRVFVFQLLEQGPQFLLLRQRPRAEWPLGPVIGPVALGEKTQDAVLREVLAETGLRRPVHLIDLATPQKELFGEVGLVEWPFAWQASIAGEPLQPLTLGPMVGEYVWLRFDEAYRRVESATDRDALVRLRLCLQ
jgi:ADP-ribose pyrophosphatase YjhB (NUDIX family)